MRIGATNFCTGWESAVDGEDRVGGPRGPSGNRVVVRRSGFQPHAEQVGTVCRDCGEPLVGVEQRERRFQTVYGEIRVRSRYGYCRRCGQWITLSDRVWGLEDKGELKSLLRDIVTWTGTLLPVALASKAVERTLGVEVCPAKVDHDAKRVGDRAVAAHE